MKIVGYGNIVIVFGVVVILRCFLFDFKDFVVRWSVGRRLYILIERDYF